MFKSLGWMIDLKFEEIHNYYYNWKKNASFVKSNFEFWLKILKKKF